jgi:hypothetical protein
MEAQLALTALLDRLRGLRIDPAGCSGPCPGWTSSGIDATVPLVSVVRTNEIQRIVIARGLLCRWAEGQGGDQP